MEIRYKIESMEESRFSYKPDFNYDSLNVNNVTYQFTHNLTPCSEKGELAMTMIVNIVPKESNEILATEEVYTIFKVEPFDKVIQVVEGGFKTTEPLLIDTFINIVIGALRGMLIKNLKGTPLSGSVMPLIPMDIIHQHTIKAITNDKIK